MLITKSKPTFTMDEELEESDRREHQSTETMYKHALIINAPIKDYEEEIAQDGKISFLYAKNILKGRFEAGERMIARYSKISFLYARDIIKGKFPMGEYAIAENSLYSFLYARDIIKAPFSLGEDAIGNSPRLAYYYATSIIKKQFTWCDFFLRRSPIYSENYLNFIDIINSSNNFRGDNDFEGTV